MMVDLVRFESVFQERFALGNPQVVVFAPGRVNLIGEHVDYSAYGVLPMAIEKSVHTALSEMVDTDGDEDSAAVLTLRIEHVLSDRFLSAEMRVERWDDLVVHGVGGQHSWIDYVVAAIKGFSSRVGLPFTNRTLCFLIDGNVPQSAGLSSSSALTCSVTFALHTLFYSSLRREEIAELCADSERLLGIASGGMDQAVSLLAEEGSALRIEFDPIRSHAVHLPKELSFVIANSLVESSKVVTAASNYNARVCEVRLAAAILFVLLGGEFDGRIRRLRDVQEHFSLSLDDAVSAVQSRIPTGRLTLSQIAELIHVEESTLLASLLTSPQTGSKLADLETFAICDRALHVFSEYSRVLAFETAAERHASQVLGLDDLASELGRLMNESHVSCAKLYECSCPELDALCETARRCGALGSRLTGAGWGGCTVSLVFTSEVDSFIASLKNEYFEGVRGMKSIDDDVVFCSLPGSGARVAVDRR